jgi:hypothetical protein
MNIMIFYASSLMLQNHLADESNKDNKHQIDVEGKIGILFALTLH